MIDTHTKEYIDTLKKVRLSDSVKTRMRDDLGAFADFHAVRVADIDRSMKQVQKISVFTLFINFQKRFMKASLLIALFLGAGGTSLAAQNTVPGDFLYPVKTHVNENVRSVLAVGPTAEAKLQADILAERLNEAQKLEASGKLKGSVASDVQSNISLQARKTSALSAKTDAQTQASISSHISGALESFTASLERGAAAATKEEVSGNESYKAAINADVEGIVGVHAKSNGEANTDVSVLITQAQARLDSVQARINGAVDVSAQLEAELTTNVKKVSDYLTEASASLKAGATAEARAHINAAQSIMDTIEASLKTGGEVQTNKGGELNTGVDLHGDAHMDGDTSTENDATVDNETNTSDLHTQSSGGVTGSLGL